MAVYKILMSDAPEKLGLANKAYVADEIAKVPNGKSAYAVAVANGFVGSETQWLDSLVGKTGPQGIQGAQGIQGPRGYDGATGPVGPQGAPGAKGDTGAVGPQGQQGVAGPKGDQGPQGLAGPKGDPGAQGPEGPQGATGAVGPAGPQGAAGQSAYQSAVAAGFVGTESQWRASLIGATGPQGAQGLQGLKGDTGAIGPQGPQGEVGPQGPAGPAGPSGDTATDWPARAKYSEAVDLGISQYGKVDPIPTGGPEGMKWTLLFNDEFEGNSLSSFWNTQPGNPPFLSPRPIAPAQEYHLFTPDMVVVEGGNLHLKWARLPVEEDFEGVKYGYHAGMVHTDGALNVGKRCYFEARIRFPNLTPGLWPAFWTNAAPWGSHWPPEIDIAEVVEDNDGEGYQARFNYHYSGPNKEHLEMGWQPYLWPTDVWHTYGCYVYDGHIDLYIDGAHKWAYVNSSVTDDQMSLILSTGIRRDRARPDDGEMTVDYVRVWSD